MDAIQSQVQIIESQIECFETVDMKVRFISYFVDYDLEVSQEALDIVYGNIYKNSRIRNIL